MCCQVSDLEVHGRLRVGLGPRDLSTLRLSFAEPPTVHMTLAPSLSAGAAALGPQLPLPLWGLLDRAVRGAADGWLARNAVAPNVYTMHLDKFKRKSELTDDDVHVATQAAAEAARRV